MTVDTRDAVIERMYSAAGGLNLWDDALAQLTTYCGAKASYIDILSEPDRAPSLVGAFGYAQQQLSRYRTYGYLFDPTTRQILANAGRPISFSDLLHRQIGGPAFHKEFIASRGTDQVLAIGLSTDIGTLLVKLSRDATGRPFTSDAADRLESVAAHVRQAVVIDRSLRRRMESDSFAATIVSRLRAAVVRVDDQMQVTFANQAALRMAGDGAVFSFADHRLRFASPQGMDALRNFVRRATANDADLVDTLVLSDDDQARRVRVWAWSSRREGQVEVGLVLLPEDYDAEVLQALLEASYGLTPSEVRTAIGVLSHSGLAAVAEHTGVSLETVRFHMKRIFSKTGTRRQSEFVRMIANDMCCIDPARHATSQPRPS